MQEFIGQIAGFIAFLAFIPYISSILKGETKPQRATFAIWSAVSIVTFVSYFASGARETIWIPLIYVIFQTVVLGLSFKYGMGGFEKLDIICLIGAAVGIIGWIVTKDPTVALYVSILVETLGFLPLIKKSYLFPKTESTLSWTLAASAAFINLFAITSFEPEIALYPIYLIITEGILAFLLLFPKVRFKKR